MRSESSDPAGLARHLVRAGSTVAMSTSLARDRRRPHSSLALAATTIEGEPLLLLSDLAVHTRNLAADPRVALLYDGRDGGSEPLSGNRICLMGQAVAEAHPSSRERYLRRHPHARRYAALADFRMYRVQIDSAHLVGGFGAIHWLTGAELAISDHIGLAAAEPELLTAMNADYQPWILPGNRDPRTEWRLVGLDPEGADFLGDDRLERLPFTRPLKNARQAGVSLRQWGTAQ